MITTPIPTLRDLLNGLNTQPQVSTQADMPMLPNPSTGVEQPNPGMAAVWPVAMGIGANLPKIAGQATTNQLDKLDTLDRQIANEPMPSRDLGKNDYIKLGVGTLLAKLFKVKDADIADFLQGYMNTSMARKSDAYKQRIGKLEAERDIVKRRVGLAKEATDRIYDWNMKIQAMQDRYNQKIPPEARAKLDQLKKDVNNPNPNIASEAYVASYKDPDLAPYLLPYNEQLYQAYLTKPQPESKAFTRLYANAQKALANKDNPLLIGASITDVKANTELSPEERQRLLSELLPAQGNAFKTVMGKEVDKLTKLLKDVRSTTKPTEWKSVVDTAVSRFTKRIQAESKNLSLDPRYASDAVADLMLNAGIVGQGAYTLVLSKLAADRAERSLALRNRAEDRLDRNQLRMAQNDANTLYYKGVTPKVTDLNGIAARNDKAALAVQAKLDRWANVTQVGDDGEIDLAIVNAGIKNPAEKFKTVEDFNDYIHGLEEQKDVYEGVAQSARAKAATLLAPPAQQVNPSTGAGQPAGKPAWMVRADRLRDLKWSKDKIRMQLIKEGLIK